jgi:hypothetical protein
MITTLPKATRSHVYSAPVGLRHEIHRLKFAQDRFAGPIDDVEQRLFGTLPDETWVYPGRRARGW